MLPHPLFGCESNPLLANRAKNLEPGTGRLDIKRELWKIQFAVHISNVEHPKICHEHKRRNSQQLAATLHRPCH